MTDRALRDTALWPNVCIVGPLPPPSGGMANQCEQLARLLRAAGVVAEVVQTNVSYRPSWVGQLRYVRETFRLLPYLVDLWHKIGRAEVVHVFANSGWAWHLVAMPALLVAQLRGVPAIVNYRGGQADEFLNKAPRHVRSRLARVELRVTPSVYLRRVFSKYRLDAEVIPNIIDLSRFGPGPARRAGAGPHLIVTRNLEPIYDIPTALRAFARIRQNYPSAQLTVAGSGAELAALERLASELGVAEAVIFSGRIDNARISTLYASADCMLNPSTVDNMPISILEALASGVPVVSTRAGGIPDIVDDGLTALLVPVGDHEAMAAAALRVLDDPQRADAMRDAGYAAVERYSWPQVMPQWQSAYQRARQRAQASRSPL